MSTQSAAEALALLYRLASSHPAAEYGTARQVDEANRTLAAHISELHLLEEVCAFYANDEDRFTKSDGNAEPYGSVPIEVGMKARSARCRFDVREAAAAAE